MKPFLLLRMIQGHADILITWGIEKMKEEYINKCHCGFLSPSGPKLSDRRPNDAAEQGEVHGERRKWLRPETPTHVQWYEQIDLKINTQIDLLQLLFLYPCYKSAFRHPHWIAFWLTAIFTHTVVRTWSAKSCLMSDDCSLDSYWSYKMKTASR